MTNWFRNLKEFLMYFLLCLIIGNVPLRAAENSATRKALVLSGGGARGFAHIGVLKALEEMGFYPDIIVGSSIGALIGVLYASGNSPDQIESYLRNTRWSKLFSSQPYRKIEFVSQKMSELPELFTLKFDQDFNIIYPMNLLPAQQLQERFFQMTVYSEFASGANYDSLVIPFRAVATDIKSGKTVVLDHGSIAKAIAASSAFPIVLAPVTMDSLLLVDGGLTNNVPCDVALDLGAQLIVAVDVTSKITNIADNVDPLSYFKQAMNTLAYPADTRNLYLADILIRPEIGNIGSSDFDALDTLIRRGYEATYKYEQALRLYQDSKAPDPAFLKQAVRQLNHASIRKIHYKGNHKTRPYILGRELLFSEGDRWNSAYAERSMKNLFSTGLFKAVYLSVSKIDSQQIDLTVEVEEEESATFSFGARYDSEKKASAFICAKYINLFGTGIDNQLSMIVSDQYRKMEWNTRTTRIFTTTLTGYSSLYHKYEHIPLYDQDGRRITAGQFFKTGLEVNAGIQIRRVGLTAFGLKLLHNRILENAALTPSIPADSYGVGSFTFRILVEDIDDPDIPTSGRSNDISYDHSISEDDLKQFDRLSIESTVYETFREIHTFYSRIRFGYINKNLSYYDQFRLGGVNSMPGYHQDELWGSLMLNLGLGYRVPVTRGIYLQVLGMFGNVWDGLIDFNWKELKFGARAGLLVPTPLGPITLDYGINSGLRHQLYISIGHYF